MTSLVLAAALVLQSPSPRPPANPTAQSVLQRRAEIRARRRLYNSQAWTTPRRTLPQPTQIRQPSHLKEAGQWILENRAYLRRIQGH